jgi:hypothetical protein
MIGLVNVPHEIITMPSAALHPEIKKNFPRLLLKHCFNALGHMGGEYLFILNVPSVIGIAMELFYSCERNNAPTLNMRILSKGAQQLTTQDSG